MTDATELVLASRSAGRALLLKTAGFCALQIDPPFADPPEPTQHDVKTARQWAMELALAKAQSAVKILSPRKSEKSQKPATNQIVLGADTIVVSPTGQWLGQPADETAARAMLESFRNQQHEVVTGVALIHVQSDNSATEPHREETFSDCADVMFGPFSEAQLTAYLQSQDWRGKAGSYNLYDLQARGWPIHFHGDDTTIVGLPMQLLLVKLAQHGLHPAAVLSNNEHSSRNTPLSSTLDRS